MKLKVAVEIGKECGLYTLGEAMDNIVLHAMNIFSYDKIDKELKELTDEFNKSDYTPNTLLEEI